MRRFGVSTLLIALMAALPAAAIADNVIVAGEDGTFVNRGRDQVPVLPGVELQAGDVVKALGRTNLKAILGDTVVIFGPLSETKITQLKPLVLELNKGVLRFITRPGGKAEVSVRTEASQVDSTGGDVLIRYNAASQFTEVIALDGSANAENRTGATGVANLESRQSTLLSPDSPPTSPSRLAERDLAIYEGTARLNIAPPQVGLPFAGANVVADRMEESYLAVRRQIARPTLPENAPFRTLDTHRNAQSTRAFDRPGLITAPGEAALNVRWNFPPPPNP